MNVRGWPVIGGVLALLWALVRGPEPTVDGVLGHLLLGLAVGLPVAFAFRRLFPDRVDPVRGVGAVPAVVRFVLTFAREVVLANLDMTYRVLAPGPPVEPEVIYVPLRLESEFAQTTLANAITLTPGTVTLDHDPEANGLFVHVIDGRDLEEVVDPIRTWEGYALTIFDESADPTAEPAEIVVSGGERRGQ